MFKFIVLLMMDAKGVRNMYSILVVVNLLKPTGYVMHQQV